MCRYLAKKRIWVDQVTIFSCPMWKMKITLLYTLKLGLGILKNVNQYNKKQGHKQRTGFRPDPLNVPCHLMVSDTLQFAYGVSYGFFKEWIAPNTTVKSAEGWLELMSALVLRDPKKSVQRHIPKYKNHWCCLAENERIEEKFCGTVEEIGIFPPFFELWSCFHTKTFSDCKLLL